MGCQPLCERFRDRTPGSNRLEVLSAQSVSVAAALTSLHFFFLIGQFSLTGQVQPLITELLKKCFHACVDGFLRRLFAVSCSLPIFFRTRKHVSLHYQLKFCTHTAVVYFLHHWTVVQYRPLGANAQKFFVGAALMLPHTHRRASCRRGDQIDELMSAFGGH